jgi:hypothetical protein
MSVPNNQLVYAGTWSVTGYYPQFQYVLSPIDGNAYVNVNIQPSVGGSDPSVQPSTTWVLIQNPSVTNAVQSVYALPLGGFFQDFNTYTGPIAKSFGGFKIPSDILPNSTALLYWSSWAVGSWSPVSPSNVLDYRFGFSAAPDVDSTQWYAGTAGFVVQTSNSNNVPLSIPQVPHTPANPANPDYTQLPQYTLLTNLQPTQDIFVNVEAVYTADVISNVIVQAPFLIYQKV